MGIVSIGAQSVIIRNGGISTNLSVVVNNQAPAFDAGLSEILPPSVVGSFARNGITFTDPGTQDTWTGTVNFGDGTGNQPLVIDQVNKTFNLSHTYVTQGNYVVTVTLKDDDNGTTVDTFGVQVILNTPPTLTADHSNVITTEGIPALNSGTFGDAQGNNTVTLEASIGSIIKNDVLGTWSWTAPAIDGPDGPISVTIKATDNFGEETSISFSLSILNVAPSITGLSATPIFENGVTTLSGVISDAGILDTFTVQVDWDADGAYDEVFLNVSAGPFTYTRQFLDDSPSSTSTDNIPIKVKVTDKDADSVTDTTVVSVTNVNPTLSDLVATSISENGTTTLSGTIADVGSLDTFTVQIDWDDDGSVDETIQNVMAGAFNFSHQYLDDSPTGTASDLIPIRIQISDDDTGTLNSNTTVAVTNVAPVLESLEITSVSENGSAVLTGTFSDIGSEDTHSISIDWGDGTTMTVSVVGGAFSIPHQYLDDNPTASSSDLYAVNVQLMDDDLGFDSLNVTTLVSNANPSFLSVNAPVLDENGVATISGAFADIGTLDTHTVEISWGDGVSSMALIDPISRTFSASHQYLDDEPTSTSIDTYPIGLTIWDDDTGMAETTTIVTVKNVNPVVTSLNSPVIDENGVATLTGTFADLGTLDSHQIEIDWGMVLRQSPSLTQLAELLSERTNT